MNTRRRSPPRCSRRTRAATRSGSRPTGLPTSGHSTNATRSGAELVGEQRRVLAVEAAEAVEVEVRHRHAAVVAARDREARARHGAGDAERAARAAHERRLAGAELAGDEHDVAGPQALRRARRRRPRSRPRRAVLSRGRHRRYGAAAPRRGASARRPRGTAAADPSRCSAARRRATRGGLAAGLSLGVLAVERHRRLRRDARRALRDGRGLRDGRRRDAQREGCEHDDDAAEDLHDSAL